MQSDTNTKAIANTNPINAAATQDTSALVHMYVSEFTDLEKKACDIARDHLKSSFDIPRSSGFVKWSKERK